MKIRILTTLLGLVLASSSSFAQFSFGISPGLGLNGSYVGYKINRFVPYFGFQYLSTSVNSEYKTQEFDYDIGEMVPYTDSYQFSGGIFIPNLGLKYFIKEKNNIKSFVSLSVSKPFLSGKIENNGVENQDFKDRVASISLWGGEFSFGVEYFFDENFSLGGEFGLRYLRLSNDFSDNQEVYNPNAGDFETVEVESNFNFNLSPSFSRISLNYYF